jgi:putative selenate reductase
MSGRQQYFVLAELCNECGNCMVFCPENGDPAQVKPKLYLNEARFEMAEGQGFLLSVDEGRTSIAARLGFEAELGKLDRLLNDPAEGVPLDLAGSE